ncbi:pentapeptide repeat protein [Actinocorallia herbida]|uniref:Pentapeptide repeat protein n=2 Tax=Actinocorallia herbida TaxID=58109 RepID=A0A3N1D627_9ACTN|nr:pentapeptide repeat protein [Actinocorallia herbida]
MAAQSWKKPLAWAVAVIGAAAGLAVLFTLFGPGAAWWVEHVDGVPLRGGGALQGKDRQEVLDSARGRLTAVGTGLLAAAAIYYTAANAASARRTARAAQETATAAQASVQAAQDGVDVARAAAAASEAAQLRTVALTERGHREMHELAERGQLGDRFTAAVAHLDGAPALRLGGVYALAGVADDAPTRALRQTCVDVLCAYLRLPYEPDPGAEADPAAVREHRALREVRRTVLRLIGVHLRLPSDDPRSWQGLDLDLTDAVLDGGGLEGAHFTAGRVSFNGAVFAGEGFSFAGARFLGGVVHFVGARFESDLVNFRGALFDGAETSFVGARFDRGTASFRDARFASGSVSFSGAVVDGGTVSFRGARFEGRPGPPGRPPGAVSFAGARFLAGIVSFREARLIGGHVDLRDAAFRGGALIFRNASFAGSFVDFQDSRHDGAVLDFGAASFASGRLDFTGAEGHRPANLPDTPVPQIVGLPPDWRPARPEAARPGGATPPDTAQPNSD